MTKASTRRSPPRGAFIDALHTIEMVKSQKMLVLLAMLNANAFSGSIWIDALADEVEVATRNGRDVAFSVFARAQH